MNLKRIRKLKMITEIWLKWLKSIILSNCIMKSYFKNAKNHFSCSEKDLFNCAVLFFFRKWPVWSACTLFKMMPDEMIAIRCTAERQLPTFLQAFLWQHFASTSSLNNQHFLNFVRPIYMDSHIRLHIRV